MFVHGSSTTGEYYIAHSLINEKALPAAKKKAWPNGWTMNCHRHLHKNCSDYRQRKVGMSDQQKRHVINLCLKNVFLKLHPRQIKQSLGPPSHLECLLSFNATLKQQSNLISPQMPLLIQDRHTITANQLITC